MDYSSNVSQQCDFVAEKTDGILGYIKKEYGQLTEGSYPLLRSVLVRLHLEYCVQFQVPHFMKDKEIQDSVSFPFSIYMYSLE